MCCETIGEKSSGVKSVPCFPCVMLFSIVIPTYNRVALLREALDSVFTQTFNDYEVIVVDDGSTDGTWEELLALGSRVHALRQENAGPGAARNLGARHAIGKYLTFLDSDDLWLPWTLENYHQAIEKFSMPSFIAGTHHDFTEVEQLQMVSRNEPVFKFYRDYLETARIGVWIGTCAAAIKRSVFTEAGGFVDEFVNAEDSDLWLRLGTAPGFVNIISPPAFGYRRHSGSAVSWTVRSIRGNQLMVSRELSAMYPGGAQRASERLQIITRHLRPGSIECLKRGHVAAGWKMYRQSFAWHIRLGRWKYLGGFPAKALFARTK